MAENTLSDEILDDKPTIAELITNARTEHWKELGMLLGLDSVHLGGCHGYADMYQLWLQEKGDGATRRVLIKALREKLLTNVADDYVKYLKKLGGKTVQTGSDVKQPETKPTNPTDVLNKVPNKLEVERLLYDLRARWHIIGDALEVDSGTLDGLQKNPESNDFKLAEVIKTWIDTGRPSVTWETLIKAIDERPVNHKRIANEIRDHLGIPH